MRSADGAWLLATASGPAHCARSTNRPSRARARASRETRLRRAGCARSHEHFSSLADGGHSRSSCGVAACPGSRPNGPRSASCRASLRHAVADLKHYLGLAFLDGEGTARRGGLTIAPPDHSYRPPARRSRTRGMLCSTAHQCVQRRVQPARNSKWLSRIVGNHVPARSRRAPGSAVVLADRTSALSPVVFAMSSARRAMTGPFDGHGCTPAVLAVTS